MRYIEENDNEVVEYELIINDLEGFKEIIDDLNEKCSHIVKTRNNVVGTSREQVLEKINSRNPEGIRIISEVEDAEPYLKGQHMYEVEIVYKQGPTLAYLLDSILREYKRNVDITGAIKNLVEFGKDGKGLQPYIDRMEKEGMTPEVYFEYELVREAYEKATSLLEMKPIKKTINYGENEERKSFRK